MFAHYEQVHPRPRANGRRSARRLPFPRFPGKPCLWVQPDALRSFASQRRCDALEARDEPRPGRHLAPDLDRHNPHGAEE